MRTQASPKHKRRVRIAGITIAGSCAVVIAILLEWVPFSIGGASDNPVPAKLSAISVQAASARKAPADRAVEPNDTPTEPTCADLGARIALPQETERLTETNATVGCLMFSNLAADTPAGSESDVEAFLAWHLQVRTLVQDIYETDLWSPVADRDQR